MRAALTPIQTKTGINPAKRQLRPASVELTEYEAFALHELAKKKKDVHELARHFQTSVDAVNQIAHRGADKLGVSLEPPNWRGHLLDSLERRDISYPIM